MLSVVASVQLQSDLKSLQLPNLLGDRDLHLGTLIFQSVIFSLEKLDFLQQGGVSQTQLLLIDFQHRQFAQRFAQVISDFVWILLKSVQQLLKMNKNLNECQVNVPHLIGTSTSRWTIETGNDKLNVSA